MQDQTKEKQPIVVGVVVHFLRAFDCPAFGAAEAKAIDGEIGYLPVDDRDWFEVEFSGYFKAWIVPHCLP